MSEQTTLPVAKSPATKADAHAAIISAVAAAAKRAEMLCDANPVVAAQLLAACGAALGALK